MTEDEKDRELVFFGRKLEAVTKECERLKAENEQLKALSEWFAFELRQIDQQTGKLLVDMRDRIAPILSRRRT